MERERGSEGEREMRENGSLAGLLMSRHAGSLGGSAGAVCPAVNTRHQGAHKILIQHTKTQYWRHQTAKKTDRVTRERERERCGPSDSKCNEWLGKEGAAG